jgi:hypothetical protein
VAPFHAKLPIEDKAYQREVLCVTAKLAADDRDGSLATGDMPLVVAMPLAVAACSLHLRRCWD